MKKTVSIVILICIIMFTGCNRSKKQNTAVAAQDTVSVRVVEIHPSSFTEHGTFYGKISAINESHIVCYMGGRVEKIKYREGAYVKAGTSLACIDTEKADVFLQTAKLQEKISLLNYEQQKKHLAEGNASQMSVYQTNLAFLSAQSTRVDAEKNRIGAFAITPISGRVTASHISLYQEIPPGTPTFTVAATNIMKVEINISEYDAAFVKTGSTAQITADMFPDRVWEGTVKYMSREVSSDNKAFTAEVHISNKDGSLSPGLTGRVNLVLRKYDKIITVPVNAVKTEGVRESVVIAGPDNKAQRRFIKTGPQTENRIVVLDGLEEGLRLITEGHHLAKDGTPLRIATN